MLRFYQRWAYRLYPLRTLILIIFVAATLSFGWMLFAAPVAVAEHWQLSIVLLAVTCLLLWLWATLFSRQLPSVELATGFAEKLKLRLQYGIYYLLALLVTLMLLATAYLGLRALKGIIAALFFG